MSRIIEPPQIHIHGELCSQLNDMIIRIKLNYDPYIANESVEQQNKIIEARKRHPAPEWEEIEHLLTACRDEMNQCTKPFRFR
jgi:hypothetical protein